MLPDCTITVQVKRLFQNCIVQNMLTGCSRPVQFRRLFQNCIGQKMLPDCISAVQVIRLLVPELYRSKDTPGLQKIVPELYSRSKDGPSMYHSCAGQKMACTRIVQVESYFWPVRGCASLNKKKSQAKAVEMTVTENSKYLFLDFIQELGLRSKGTSSPYQNYAGKKMLTACIVKLCRPRDAPWYVIFRLKADEKLLLEPARQNRTQSRVKKSWGSLFCKTIRQS